MGESPPKSIYTDEYRVVIDCLRKSREARGLTQTELALLLGRDQSYVSKYERAERRLDIIELRLVCLALGTTLPEFVSDLEARLQKGMELV